MKQNAAVQNAAVEAGGEVFMPVRVSTLRLDTTPRFDLYFRPGPDQPFVLYRERHVPFTEKVRQMLLDNRLDCLFVKQAEYEGYKRYLAAHLPDTLADPHLPMAEKAEILYTSAMSAVEGVMQKADAEGVRHSKEVVRHTVDFLTRKDFMLRDLLRALSSDYYLSAHSVNVVAYAVSLARRAGYGDSATLREVANGAMLHDVGMIHVDPAIRESTGSLTAGEWREIQEHPAKGHAMLADTGCLGEVALDIVLHHHEKLDGRGYPDKLDAETLSPFVRIVTIADVFDALTTERKHQPALSSFEALNVMQRDAGSALDPELLRVFIETLGLRR